MNGSQPNTLPSMLWPWLAAGAATFIVGLTLSNQLDEPWSFRASISGVLLWAASWAVGMWRTGPAHWLVEDAYAALWRWLLLGLFFFIAGFAFSLLGSFFGDPRSTLEVRVACVCILGMCVVVGIWDWLRG